jgi:hypothetical protein
MMAIDSASADDAEGRSGNDAVPLDEVCPFSGVSIGWLLYEYGFPSRKSLQYA